MSQLELNSEQNDGFEERETYFADVILPIAIPGAYTYRVPKNLEDNIAAGGRVIVQFGKSRIITGVVRSVHQHVPKKYEAKYILESLDVIPSFNEQQLDFFQWIAEYYMCTIGEVVNAALPSGLKLSSESFVQLNPEADPEISADDFTDRELKVLNHLHEVSRLSYQDISDLLGIKLVHPIIKSLIQKDRVIIYDKVKDKYSPKTERYVKLAPGLLKGSEPLKDLFEKLETKPKQLDILLRYLSLVGFDGDADRLGQEVLKSSLMSPEMSPSSLKTLVKNGFFEEFQKTVPRFNRSKNRSIQQRDLSPEQTDCLGRTIEAFQQNKPVLLHGITGSGKTEIYVELIRQVLEEGGQVLYLVPEIALTTQIVSRLFEIFGDSMGVYHSRYSDNERVEIWNEVKEGKLNFVVGVRSSVFLPFDDLHLLIIDEEHDSSFKQYDPSPRFHARDASLWLARKHNARVLMGTATPSIESYQNALDGKYQLVEIKYRWGGASLPAIIPANILTARKAKRMKGDFTPELIAAIKDVLEHKKQVIVFQNRRGYSPYLICDDCNHVPRCQNCDVSLTYHMYRQELVCHYCGHKEPMPNACEACESTAMRTVGFGTEKIEEDLKLLFPEANIERMDQDSTRSKTAYQTIIDRFAQSETDILVGTQMLSKGLHFDKVALVGILDFDRIVHFPDFRSHERAFQLTTQVAGRAGRVESGQVIVQTGEPEHSLLDKIRRDDYNGFFSSEVIEREKYKYPPFYRLIRIVLKHPEQSVIQKVSKELATSLSAELGTERVLGPQQPVIGRIKNLYLEEILIKIEKQGVNIGKVKGLLYKKAMEAKSKKEYQKLRVVFDVDPV